MCDNLHNESMNALFSLVLPLLLFAMPLLVSAQTVVPPEELYAGGPPAPVIISTTHPSEAEWYRSAAATFAWELPSDVTAVAIDLSTSSVREPMQAYRPAVSSISFASADFSEGTNYLSVQFRNSEKWGMYSGREVKIDDTAPQTPLVTISQILDAGEEKTVLTLESRDSLSGLSHYEMMVDGQLTKRLSVTEAERGYALNLAPGQTERLTIVAFDKAGNKAETSVILVPTKIDRITEEGLFGVVAEEPASFLVALMAAIMLLMFGYLVYERLRYARSLSDLRKETAEVHNQLIRIFSALREEIYDQIRGITKKGRMTKGEVSAVEGLNQALAVSESLIEKEVKDVKKLLEK